MGGGDAAALSRQRVAPPEDDGEAWHNEISTLEARRRHGTHGVRCDIHEGRRGLHSPYLRDGTLDVNFDSI